MSIFNALSEDIWLAVLSDWCFEDDLIKIEIAVLCDKKLFKTIKQGVEKMISGRIDFTSEIRVFSYDYDPSQPTKRANNTCISVTTDKK
jgi:hypothetical protein